MAPVLQACAARGKGARSARPLGRIDAEDVRARLRSVVSELSRRFSHASAFASLRRVGRVMADADAHTAGQELELGLVLAVEQQGRRFEQAIVQLDRDSVARAAAALSARASASYQANKPARPLASPRDLTSSWREDPAAHPPHEWVPRVEDLYQRSQHHGGSRVVYRGAYLLVDDVIEIHVGHGRDLLQRLVRTRAGVILLAQRGVHSETIPVVEIAETSGLMGLEATAMPESALESAADRVHSMVSPSAHPTGDLDILLDPSCAALFAHHCVGAGLRAHHWVTGEARAADFLARPVGSEHVTLVDDPTLAGAYGSYFFDHQGRPAAATPLIDRGVLQTPVTDHQSAQLLPLEVTANSRRAHAGAALAPEFSNLAFAAGRSSREDLIAAVDQGLLLEGGVFARAHPRSWRFVLRAARAREIRSGKITGVLYSDIDIHGDVPALLGAVRGVSSSVARTPAPGELPSTMGSPFLLTRARVR